MRNKYYRTVALAAIGMLVLGFSVISLPAYAKTEKGSYTDPSCKSGSSTAKACGAVVMINAGGFEINPIKLEWLNPQGDDYTPASACNSNFENIDISVILYEGDYYVLTVPADCGYEGKLKIESVTTKSHEIFLVPGCQLEMKVTGTIASTDLHIDVSWAKQTGKSGPVVDSNGLKCGKYGKRSN